jgi:hypothetical protein
MLALTAQYKIWLTKPFQHTSRWIYWQILRAGERCSARAAQKVNGPESVFGREGFAT